MKLTDLFHEKYSKTQLKIVFLQYAYNHVFLYKKCLSLNTYPKKKIKLFFRNPEILYISRPKTPFNHIKFSP